MTLGLGGEQNLGGLQETVYESLMLLEEVIS